MESVEILSLFEQLLIWDNAQVQLASERCLLQTIVSQVCEEWKAKRPVAIEQSHLELRGGGRNESLGLAASLRSCRRMGPLTLAHLVKCGFAEGRHYLEEIMDVLTGHSSYHDPAFAFRAA